MGSDNQAKLIKKAREKLGLSQQELADRIGFGSAQSISNIERGVIPFPASRARRMCEILGIQFSTTWRAAVVADSWEKYTRKGRAA